MAKKSIEVILENIYPKYKILGEPQMGRRGLYPSLSTKTKNKLIISYMDFLQYSDGSNSLKKISTLINLDYKSTKMINSILLKNNLISN